MKQVIDRTIVEWDVNKNALNMRKHGISFETAALVFADEERIEYYDELHSVEEDRYIVIGRVHGILYVVYTMRDEAVRMISARMATARERKVYYGE
ncbi:MAG: BrnT family toxin [Clostridiales bacterium]|nr:BrnT family toxin [Clostridiales bacterium]